MLLYNPSENLKIALRKEINEGAVSRVLEMIKAFKSKKFTDKTNSVKDDSL